AGNEEDRVVRHAQRRGGRVPGRPRRGARRAPGTREGRDPARPAAPARSAVPAVRGGAAHDPRASWHASLGAAWKRTADGRNHHRRRTMSKGRIERRDFLKTAGAAAIATAWPLRSFAQAGEP